MNWEVFWMAAVIAAIITGTVTLLVAIIGDIRGIKALREAVENNKNTILKRIGENEKESLSEEHKNIVKSICSIRKTEITNKKKIRKIKREGIDMQSAINSIKALIDEDSAKTEKITELEKEIEILKNKNNDIIIAYNNLVRKENDRLQNVHMSIDEKDLEL